MRKKKKRIYIQTWLEFKPYEKQTVTDSYYLQLSNTVKHAIVANKQSFVLQQYLDNEDIDKLACFLTSYFEDVISETNLWSSFVNTHKALYKKQVPFYNLDDYCEAQINIQDICFLIWYYLNTIQEEQFYQPFYEFIYETAEKVFAVFDEAGDETPVNEDLKSVYQLDENESDYYIARGLIDTILFKSYLFYPDTSSKLRAQEHNIIETSRYDEHIVPYLNENRDSVLYGSTTRLLALKGKEWAASVLGDKHPLASDFLNISERISGYFLYKGQDADNIVIEHIASGKVFDLTKESYDDSETLKEVDTILFMGIARWQGKWWFSGISFQQSYDPDIVMDEKNSFESRMTVNFLDHQKLDTNEIISKQFKAFKKINKGVQIAFMPSDRIQNFVTAYTEQYNKSLRLSSKEQKEAKLRLKEDGFSKTKDGHPNYTEISETGLVFFNPKSGLEIALGVNSAFPMQGNPYYAEASSEEHTMRLLMAEELSTELVMFCIENCKKKLPFFNQGIGEIYLNDIDFLLRFWNSGHYHSKPSITYFLQKGQ